jgi:hypothetical protein
MNSFLGVITLLFISTYYIVGVFKYIRYKVANRNNTNTSAVNAEGPPLLILDYNNENKIGIMGMLSLLASVLCIFSFFAADWISRSDMYLPFFSLSNEQTYILYYWTWKFVGMFGFLVVGIALMMIRASKSCSFYKNMIILDKGVFGKKVLPLDSETIWKPGVGRGRKVARISNSKAGFLSTIAVSSDCMELSYDQNKVLNEILSKIPQKGIW